MTRIIRPVGPRAKRLRAADEDGAAKGHVRHFEFASPNRLWRTRRKSALFPHCSRIATFFVSSLDAALRLLVLRHARKKIFVSTIPTRRTLSVTNVTSLVFIFFMSDIPNADTFDRVFRRPAELAFRRNGDALSLLAAQILQRPNMHPC